MKSNQNEKPNESTRNGTVATDLPFSELSKKKINSHNVDDTRTTTTKNKSTTEISYRIEDVFRSSLIWYEMNTNTFWSQPNFGNETKTGHG